MRKNVLVLASLLALFVSCQKENTNDTPALFTMGVSVENVDDSASKVTLTEDGDYFDLAFEGNEVFALVDNTNSTSPCEWLFKNGSTTEVTGNLTANGKTQSVNYFLILNNKIGDYKGAGASQTCARAAIQPIQSYSSSSILSNCMLMGKTGVCAANSSLPGVELKILNSFIKFRVKKGVPAEGEDAFASGMYIKEIQLSSVNGESVAGRFDFEKNTEDWISTRVVSSTKYSSIKLDCGNTQLSESTFSDFYVALAYNTYAKGLSVTFTITDNGGKEYKITKTIGKSGVTLDRKTLYPIDITLYPTISGGDDPEPPTTPTEVEWNGGQSSTLTGMEGVSASGLGSDYAASNAPYRVKFDTTGDYIIVNVNYAISSVQLKVKMIGGTTASKITIQESADGETYTDVQDMSISGSANSVVDFTTTNAFKSASRYVKLYFTKGSNVGLGYIKIAATK